ncbi:hypothetical protein D3C72_2315870 [compost metagenome]
MPRRHEEVGHGLARRGGFPVKRMPRGVGREVGDPIRLEAAGLEGKFEQTGSIGGDLKRRLAHGRNSLGDEGQSG